jgi:uncharacterized protein (TIGR02145 family)
MQNCRHTRISTLSILAGWVLLFSGCDKEPNTPKSGVFIDSRDQNEYKWETIGTQTWMAENLAWLPSVNRSTDDSETSPCYYVFRYEGTNVENAREWEYYDTYGVFYNWPAALDGADSSNLYPSGVRGACPEGWHLPSDAEWDTLVTYLGGEYSAGKLMKSTKGWNSYEGEPGKGNNLSGFNALPAGARHNGGGFYNLGFSALYWSSTGYAESSAWYRYLGYFHNGVYRYFSNTRYGFSIRCVKDK